MDAKKNGFIWVGSFVLTGIATVILVGTNLAGVELADTVVRVCGAVELVSLPVFVFSTVKKVKSRK